MNLSELTIADFDPTDYEWEDGSEASLAGIAKMLRKYQGCSILAKKNMVFAFYAGSEQKIMFQNNDKLKSEFVNRGN